MVWEPSCGGRLWLSKGPHPVIGLDMSLQSSDMLADGVPVKGGHVVIQGNDKLIPRSKGLEIPIRSDTIRLYGDDPCLLAKILLDLLPRCRGVFDYDQIGFGFLDIRGPCLNKLS
jgi:hypothetical protein